MIVEREVDRVLTLLRNKIRERGFSQLDVQEVLGWGRSYISQLLTRQKSLRFEQVLLILSVIGIEPAEFFGELYATAPGDRADRYPPPGADETIVRLRRQLSCLVDLLLEKELITAEDLSATVHPVDLGSDLPAG